MLNIAPEKWLGHEFPFGKVHIFRGKPYVKPQECCWGCIWCEIVCLGGLGVRMISLELLLAKGTFQISGGSGGVGCMVGLKNSVDGLKLQNFWDFCFHL